MCRRCGRGVPKRVRDPAAEAEFEAWLNAQTEIIVTSEVRREYRQAFDYQRSHGKL